MKFRKGFVTNSSSSSFICDVCGHDASGWDIGLRDAEMYQCVDGHTFCEEHIGDVFADPDFLHKYLESNIQSAKDRVVNSYATERKIAEWVREAEQDLADFLSGDKTADDFDDELSDARGELPVGACPICQFTDFINDDVLEFILKENNFDVKVIQASIKDRFKSYREFKNWKREK